MIVRHKNVYACMCIYTKIYLYIHTQICVCLCVCRGNVCVAGWYILLFIAVYNSCSLYLHFFFLRQKIKTQSTVVFDNISRILFAQKNGFILLLAIPSIIVLKALIQTLLTLIFCPAILGFAHFFSIFLVLHPLCKEDNLQEKTTVPVIKTRLPLEISQFRYSSTIGVAWKNYTSPRAVFKFTKR